MNILSLGGVVICATGLRRRGKNRVCLIFHISPKANYMDHNSGVLGLCDRIFKLTGGNRGCCVILHYNFAVRKHYNGFLGRLYHVQKLQRLRKPRACVGIAGIADGIRRLHNAVPASAVRHALCCNYVRVVGHHADNVIGREAVYQLRNAVDCETVSVVAVHAVAGIQRKNNGFLNGAAILMRRSEGTHSLCGR